MWTCRAADNPRVVQLLDGDEPADMEWADCLERAAGDAVTGKVLCVCAGAGIARHVLASGPPSEQAEDALALLEAWIDEPTDARFECIARLLFDEQSEPRPELDAVTWWALRVATSSLGNYEAEWALSSLCLNAATAGLTPEEMRTQGLGAVRARLR